MSSLTLTKSDPTKGICQEEEFPVYTDEGLGLNCELCCDNFEELSDDNDYQSDEELVQVNRGCCINQFFSAMQEQQAQGMDLARLFLVNSNISDRCANPHLFDRMGQLRSFNHDNFDYLDSP